MIDDVINQIKKQFKDINISIDLIKTEEKQELLIDNWGKLPP